MCISLDVKKLKYDVIVYFLCMLIKFCFDSGAKL